MWSKTQVGVLLFAAATAVSGVALSGDAENTYDYIVVGSGPGGGSLASNLARAGWSTLLIEAGDNEIKDPATNVAGLFKNNGIPSNVHWDFWVKHHDDIERTKKYNHLVWRLTNGNLWVGPGSEAPTGAIVLGVNYPRGATLGGSSIINAGAVFLPNDSEWDYIKKLTGDDTWSSENLRRLFQKLERNQYLPKDTPGHGFDGYVSTNIGDGTQYTASSQAVDVLESMVAALGKNPADLNDLLKADANYLSPQRDVTPGMWALPFHVNTTWGRSSARGRILDTLNDAKGYPLKLQLNSLATRVILDKSGDKPRASGVEFLEGKSLYQGDPRYDPANKGKLSQVFARKEVIISGGAFNTPQLLQLSGIGNASDLAKVGIKPIVDLPGVGTNMQDNQEIGVISLASDNFTFAGPAPPACTFGNMPDPCYDLWLEGKGPYTSAGPNSNIVLLQTNHSVNGERDMTIFSGPFAFRGFWPETPNQTWPEPPNTWGMHTVKMNPQNRAGYVKLRSNDPTAMPEINFRLYTEGSDTDIGAIKDAVAWGRRVVRNVGAPTGPFVVTNPPCDSNAVQSDGSCGTEGADEEYIRNQSFGHHVTSTCPIGKDGDPNAVLDSKFRVRGVLGLRVVDASVFPKIPGSFPVVATYMISEKAAEDILDGKMNSSYGFSAAE